jgi:TP901 family phage tail tape measure protein
MADRAVTLKIQIDSETYEVEATREEVQKLQRELNQSGRSAQNFGDETEANADQARRAMNRAADSADHLADSTENASGMLGGIGQDARNLGGALRSGNLGQAANSMGALAAKAAPVAGALYAAGRGAAFVGGKAVSFEKALTGVAKTTGLVGDKLDALGEDLQGLAGQLGVGQNELARIAETAGQLGIEGRANIAQFTETTAKLASVTQLTAEEASTQIAKISNAFNLPIRRAENLGSVLNGLSNTTTAKAGDISRALTRVGNSASAIGLTADEVAALGATLIDSGVQAETAGTSLRNVFIRMQSQAGELASQIGLTSERFSAMIQEDALSALRRYLAGLREMPEAQRAIRIKEIFGDENFLAVQSLTEQVDLLNTNLDRSAQLSREGTSLNEEFARTLETVSKQWQRLKGNLLDVATTIGSAALPGVQSLLEAINGLFEGTEALADETKALRAEQENLQGVEEAITTYKDLADQTGLSEEKQKELNEAVKTLKDRFPGFVTETENAAGTVRIYAEAAQSAYEAQNRLNREQRKANLEKLVEGYREQRKELKNNTSTADTLSSKIKHLRQLLKEGRPEDYSQYKELQKTLGNRAPDAAEFARDAIQNLTEELKAQHNDGETSTRLNDDYVRALASIGQTAEGLDLDAISQALTKVMGDAAEADKLARRVAKSFYDLDSVNVQPQVDVSGLEGEKLSESISYWERRLTATKEYASAQDATLQRYRQREEAQATLNALLERQKQLQQESTPPPGGDGDGDARAGPSQPSVPVAPQPDEEELPVAQMQMDYALPEELPDDEKKALKRLEKAEQKVKYIRQLSAHGIISDQEASKRSIGALETAMNQMQEAGIDPSSAAMQELKGKIDEAKEKSKGDWGAAEMRKLQQTARQATQIIGQLFRQQHRQRMQEIRREKRERLRAIDERKERELSAIDRQISAAAKGSKRRKKLRKKRKKVEDQYRNQREQAEQKFKKKQAKAKRKQAKMDKAAALFEIGINTASAVAEALPNIPLSITAGAIGAMQASVVASKPLPEVPSFASGAVGLTPQGVVEGPGGPTDDQIAATLRSPAATETPIRVSAGESIINAASTSAAPNALAAMNDDPALAEDIERSVTRTDELQRFAEGAVRVKQAQRMARGAGDGGDDLDNSELLEEMRKTRAATERQTERIDEQTQRLEDVERSVGIEAVDEKLAKHRERKTYRQ